jgi:outer membrane receptor protein involved in Fe transport
MFCMPSRIRRGRRSVLKPWIFPLLFALCLSPTDATAQAGSAPQPQPPTVEETVVVVGVTPVDGIGVDRDRLPANLQILSAEQLERTGGFSAVEQLSLSAASVHINEASTNPLQPDLQYRGFTASPLLGLPQGLAVYQNGIRLNEPFGDTVNWDLVPTEAIAGINLMPGSNPLFGLNALGGAIMLRTKTGFSHPGHSLAVTGGSFGRYMAEGASGTPGSWMIRRSLSAWVVISGSTAP